MSDLFFVERYLFQPQESAAQLSASVAWSVPFARVVVRGRNSRLTFRCIQSRALPYKVSADMDLNVIFLLAPLVSFTSRCERSSST
jgi:hypothetical protein